MSYLKLKLAQGGTMNSVAGTWAGQAGKIATEVELFYSGLYGSLLKIKNLGLAWGLHFLKQWGRRTEDPFRGLRAGPVRYSPLFLFPPICRPEFPRDLTHLPQHTPNLVSTSVTTRSQPLSFQSGK